MADLSITAANVVPATDATIENGTSGGTITAGMPVYIDDADDGKIKPTDADALASAVAIGLAVNGASAGQPVDYVTAGDVTIGATVVLGIPYYVTPNAGGLGVWAEVLPADYATIVCMAVSTTVVNVKPIVSNGVKV
jgi:hypothetical protein